MATTQLGVIIDALVSTLSAQDGPPKERPNVGQDLVYIGWDGSEDGSEAAVTSQEWVDLGHRARDEFPAITCYAESTRGNGTIQAVRDAVLTTVAATETALRDDPTLGVLSQPGWAWFASVDRLVERWTDQGPLAGVVFTISARARL